MTPAGELPQQIGKRRKQKDRARQATVHVTQEAADIVRQAYLLAGTSALREGPLQRCFRDIHAGSQHFFASPASTLDFARDLMAAAPESALDAEASLNQLEHKLPCATIAH